MPFDDTFDPERGQRTWEDYFLGPGAQPAEAPTTPGGGDVNRGLLITDPNGNPRLPDITTLLGLDGSSGGGNFDFGGGSGPFPSSNIRFDLGTLPRFVAPRFVAPTAESVRTEPGYEFGLSEGERALQQSAAGKGVLRTGGTLKDINAWGQNYAGQKYTDAFNRALSSFDREYQGSLDMYKPLLTQWQTQAAANQRAAELAFQREWDQYTFGNLSEFQRQQLENQPPWYLND